MDPALKKRMIGAAILIVLAVIFVPMLFTGRPNERTETVDLNLPKAPDRDFTTRTIPLDTAPKPAPQPSDALPTVDTAKEREAGGGAAPAPAPAQAAKTEPPVPTPNPKAQPPAPGTPEPAAADKLAETSAGSSEHGRWAVSYGTYAKLENADKLVADLKKAGIAAYGEPVAVKDAMGVRVRSGPYLDKSQAEKARLSARTARADVTGKVVELDDTTPHEAPPAKAAVAAAAPSNPSATEPKPPAAATSGATAVTGFAVQVGAYTSEKDADGRRDALRNAGFSAYVEPVKTAKGTLYRLRVGPVAERAGADRLRAELKEKMRLDGTVVQEP